MLRLQVPHPTLDKDLAALLESQHDADVKFKVENAEFAAHKLVLTFRSPFFRYLKHRDTSKTEGVDLLALRPHLNSHEYGLIWLRCPRLRLNVSGFRVSDAWLRLHRHNQCPRAGYTHMDWHACLIWQVAARSMTPKCTFCIAAWMLLEMWRHLTADQHHACRICPEQPGAARSGWYCAQCVLSLSAHGGVPV